uniref:YvlB/LiaX N-terminal domain-containing protein n=1 Tax=candidate division WOR-3 bacterium TaxID=2052148 RepID=A0A7C4Y6Z5_UNCW3
MNEKLKVLKMLEEGKITAEEAEKLLNAIDRENVKGKRLVIRVKGPDENINLSLPLNFIKAMMKFSGKCINLIPEDAKEKMKEQGVDISKVLEEIDFNFPDEQQVIVEGRDSDSEFYIGIE